MPHAWRPAPRPSLALPAATQGVFDTFLRERFPKASTRRLDAAVEQVSAAFTAERGTLAGSYLNQPPVRSAYLAHFHPQQVLRGLAALDETTVRAASRGLLPPGPVRIADLGAGLGAMTQAWLLTAAAPAVSEVVFVDHQRSAAADARDLLQRVHAVARPGDEAPRVRTAGERLEHWLVRARDAGWRYDVVLLGAVLNEERGPWEPILAGVLQILEPGGIVVVVEPALDVVARRLMALRESALDAVTTVAPCPHDRTCPLLAASRDWCFSVRAVDLPPAVVRRARHLGHQTREIRYALWSFRAPAVPEPFTGDLARVVSDPMEGGHLLCGQGGTLRVPALPGARRGDLRR